MSIKNNLKDRINHQTQTDLTSEWFNFDKKFKAKRFTSFINYKVIFARKTSSNWLELNLKQFQINILQSTEFMSKNIITILTTLLLIFGLGGATAQAFAPDNLKPTALYQKLFAANKQVERDPYTSLKPDTNNFVSKLDQCDLSLKYPRSLSDASTLGVFREGYGAKEENPLLIESFSLQTEYIQPGRLANFNFDVQCFKPPYQVPAYDLPVTTITKDQLQAKTGWFITQADIKDIKVHEGNSYGSTVGYGQGYEFVYNKRKYLIYGIEKALKASEISSADLQKYYGGKLPDDFTDQVAGVFSNQVQIQFDSLTDNVADKEVKSTQTPLSNTTQPTTLPNGAQQTTTQTQTNQSAVKSSVIATQPADSALVKTVFRPNEGCGEGIPENQAKLADEQVVSYASKDAIMTITNSNYSFNKSDNDIKNAILLFDLVLNNKPIPINPDSSVKDLSIFGGIFRTSCSGYYNYVLQDLNTPNFGQKSRASLSLAGQDEIGIPTVFIYAQNGDDLILISGGSLFTENELDQIIKSCGYDRKSFVDFEKFDATCYKKKLSSNEVLTKANKVAQDLVNQFRLK